MSAAQQKALLIVLDGFGIGKDSPFNSIRKARKPFLDGLLAKYPHSELLTHGNAVGLPDGVMGNSEVGHMTMGAGRILYQDLTRISKSITDGTFYRERALLELNTQLSKSGGRIHLMGLLSDGGVHSHIEHLEALLKFFCENQAKEIYIHAFLDGRDTSPGSAAKFLKRTEDAIASLKAQGLSSTIKIASLSGRYFAMDRDNRWDRVEKAYRVLTGEAPVASLSAIDAFQASQADGKTDEFVEPVLLDSNGAIRASDCVLFFNYRSDRARELTSAFISEEFAGFDRRFVIPRDSYLCMTQYDAKLKARLIFEPQNLDLIFPQVLEQNALRQFRIAETEKYAHVTFFFNGGREAPFVGEERLLIPSPKDVATYDLKPEMSADTVAEELKKRIESTVDDFILVNFANADMVGHTGNFEAAVRAIECLDRCMEKVIGAAEKNGFHTLLTADHGNAEEMCDHEGHIHTQHTLNPVPALYVGPNSATAPRADRLRLKDGGLSDIMPTLLDIMGLPIPAPVTGKTLFEKIS